MPDVSPPPFGVYVHWPFCAAKCPYCDFNSHVIASVEVDDWRAGFARAIAWFAAQAAGAGPVGSVFFGGGTPSLMPASLVEEVIGHIAEAWGLADDVEITLEANPGSADAARFADYAAAGVNRLSLGVQALDDAALKQLGRIHTVREALTAWELAVTTFPRASFDLITARPGQSPAQWERELARAVALRPAHLSVYHLTMEPETPFHKLHERGKLTLPGEDTALQLAEITTAMLAAAGLRPYEISNYAAPGEECRHNLLYWRYHPYAGIGPGAHSRLAAPAGRRRALAAIRAPGRWLAAARHGGIAEDDTLSPEQAGLEYLLMSLRTTEGLDPARYERLAGQPLDGRAIADLRAAGLLRERGARLSATGRGRLVLERLIAELAA
ncbi:MAG TPA: coproporphyrinogen III oxidase [Thermopetrobacter sp.]|nr:coproporphyrinogen III oxidase [Thermopetrobacter sp.]